MNGVDRIRIMGDTGSPYTRKMVAVLRYRHIPYSVLWGDPAVAAGESVWETEIDGTLWTQKSFPYQAKCLRWMNEHYAALDAQSRSKVKLALAGTGCEPLLLEE